MNVVGKLLTEKNSCASRGFLATAGLSSSTMQARATLKPM